MKIVENVLAKLAVVSARSGAGSASLWYSYQPKEPDMKKINK